MNKNLSKVLQIVIPLAISAVILYFLYRDFNFPEFWQGLSDIRLGWLLFALLFSQIGPLLRGMRWKQLLYPLGYTNVPMKNMVLSVYTGYAMNILIPRFGEICRCALLERYNKVPFGKSLGSMVAERVVDFVLLLLICASIVLAQLGNFIKLMTPADVQNVEEVAKSHTGLWITIGVIAVCLIVFFMFKDKLMNAVKDFVSGFWQGFLSLKQVENLPLFLAYSVGIWVSYFFELYLAFYAFNFTAELGISVGLLAFAGCSLAVLIPTPNGAGPWHGAIIAVLCMFGVTDVDARTFALVVHTSQTFIYLFGGLVGWVLMLALNKEKKNF